MCMCDITRVCVCVCVCVCVWFVIISLFEMGFGPQINELLRLIPEQRQTLLFSATMPTQLVEFSRAGLRDPETVRLDSEVKLPELLRMLFFTVRSEEKVGCLMYLLRNFIAAEQQSIVFVATRQEVEWLATVLSHVSIDCAMVYGRMVPLLFVHLFCSPRLFSNLVYIIMVFVLYASSRQITSDFV
jgi:hypothetical protein